MHRRHSQTSRDTFRQRMVNAKFPKDKAMIDVLEISDLRSEDTNQSKRPPKALWARGVRGERTVRHMRSTTRETGDIPEAGATTVPPARFICQRAITVVFSSLSLSLRVGLPPGQATTCQLESRSHEGKKLEAAAGERARFFGQ
jgi:hypothetical protein